jgi:Fe-S-cluster containining protein
MRRIVSTHYHRGVTAHAALDRVVAAWDNVRERFGAYSLVLPGTPSFICQPNLCTAQCCHAFSVNMGEAEAERMARETGMARVQFLELDEGEPITLPLAQPFLLAREGGHCRFLGPELDCTVYSGRPNACRLYPHFVVFVDAATGKVTTPAPGNARPAVEALLAGQSSSPVPLLLGHVECPGFTGDPLPEASWRALLEATYQLQYEEL